ncbi:FAD-dependent oxidoreductase [Actinopolymorpha pittospori]
MRSEQVRSDVTVIGGGLAGVCAAIAAARAGSRVALVQNRPVLGGNSSSEVRVWVCGATGHGFHRNARETGIMGELFVENQYRNREGNPYYWDLTVLEAVRAEPNITLFLNTDVTEVQAEALPTAQSEGGYEQRVVSVTGWMSGSERRIRFESPVFIDCSGDGLIGFLAGADFRTGREAYDVYQEPWAPQVPDDNTLGSTILFYTKDVGRPAPFVPPPFAKDITETAIPDRRVIAVENNGCAYWWIEWGGELDVVDDNETIRDELQSVVYGIWDYIKNSGRFAADNLTLEWIGSVPGKREYRRFVGDHVLTQHDVLGQTEFPDRVAFGGWSIDLHPPGGVYASERGSRHWHADGNYHIPLRCLYSRNVANLWMAGRDISASHVAFGSTRVMATCAVLGEAAGLAAHLALSLDCSPRELARDHVTEVRRALVRTDASVLGISSEDPHDLAPRATVTASSTLRQLAVEVSTDTEALDAPLGIVLPVAPSLGALELLVDARADTTLDVAVHTTGKPQNYLPADQVGATRVTVSAGEKQWVRVNLDWTPQEAQNAFVVLAPNPDLKVHRSATTEPGLLFFRHREMDPDEQYTEQWRSWKHVWHREGLCLRLVEQTDAYAPQRAVGGYARPYGGPQLWASEPLAFDPHPWLELQWPEPVAIRQLAVIFDVEVEEDLINLHHHWTPSETMPGLVRDYEIQARTDGQWHPVAGEQANRRRTRRFDVDLRTDALRVVVHATNGAPRAHIVSVRAYDDRR